MNRIERGLTPLQRKFIEEYIQDYNKIAAYRRAIGNPDYAQDKSYQSARKILKKQDAIDYMRALQEEALKQSGLSAAKILKKLESIMDDPTSTKTEQMKAADLISKNMGLQTTKVEATAKVLVINIDDDDDNTD